MMARRKAEYQVAEESDGTALLPVANVTGTEAGRRWIKENGTEGETYRVVAFVTGRITVAVESVRKVKLEEDKEAADASAPEA